MRRRSKLPKVFPWILLLIFIGVVFVVLGRTIFPTASRILLHANAQIESVDGRTNILLLGTGGAQHDGPNLTDTIILLSVDQKNDKAMLISIPRDLWVAEVGQNGGKINEAYADGELNNQQKGLLYAKSIVREVTGLPVQYGVRVQFDGFVKAVDALGGIDVQVDNTLDDYNYPIDGKEDDTCGHSDDEIKSFTATASAESDLWQFFSCRYTHLHVPAGMVHMDGTLALEFVRSRHGVGTEGSDFARSRRQQHVIEAFRTKLLSAGTLFNVPKLFSLYNIMKNSIDTDIPEEDVQPFISLAQKLKSAKITSIVLDIGDDSQNRPGLLAQGPISSDFGYQFILLPRTGLGNYEEIKSFISCEITKGNCTISKNPSSSQ